MSSIYVKMDGVTGGSENPAYTGQIECLGVHHAINLPVNAGQSSQARIQGSSVHGPVVLYHHFDQSSPVLRQMALGNAPSKQVVINVVRNINGENKVVESITLTDVKVGRVDVATLVDKASGEPGGQIVEAFALNYAGKVTWNSTSFDSTSGVQNNSIAGGWDIANSQIVS